MSFLNGISGLAAGLSSFGANAAKEEPAPPPAALDPVAAAPLAAAPSAGTPLLATPPPATPAATPGKPGGAIPAGVPPELLPIYKAAAVRTGIPVSVLIAQGKQESGFRNDAVGKAGELGIAQILPSTAAQPGYGLKPVDPKTLTDPRVSINFQADYLRARAGLGADFSNPSAVDAALRHYNGDGGGGDPNYVNHVRQHMAGA